MCSLFQQQTCGSQSNNLNLTLKKVNPSPISLFFQNCKIYFSGQRIVKFKEIYATLFVCLAMKAIHLDFVTVLKSELFIANS